MATETVSGQQPVKEQPHHRFFTGHRRRVFRENLTAYLFLTPALLVIFTFGIFPIIYAAYVSLYKWRIKQNEWRGLDNYVNAMGDVAYVFFFLIALALLIIGVVWIYRAVRDSRKSYLPWYTPFLSIVPAVFIAWGLGLILLAAVTFFAQDQAIEAGEAQKLGNPLLGTALIIVGLIISAGVQTLQARLASENSPRVLPNFTTSMVTVVITIVLGYVLANFTYNELLDSTRYGLAVTRVRFLILSLIPLILGYLIWTWGARSESNWKLLISIVGGTIFIAASVWMASIWPVVSMDSDADFYQSLVVTIFYSLLTVPVQLGISMVLAYLLYQNLRGKGMFRVLYFIPYIAPAVATAGIFDAMFSLRPDSFANSFMAAFGAAPMKWLKEPGPAISAIGEAFGIEAAANWTFGPSLALVVIILYNIWVFVGYDTVIFLAGLGNIPFSLYEAAKIDGASRWGLFRHITFPLLSPTTYFLSVISVIGTFKAFNHIYILRDPAAQGTVDAASVHFFVTFFRGSRFGYSTSMAMVLFVIILILYIVQNRIAARSVHYG